ncbi:hypothetical protein PROFUN_06673 [Planoprotostelium fungivorum]|uniref:Uncharacterized protein n=1 Tax=Planoprotostelium fungivorum TaxID=1890364 RepID=A0A2P6MSY1_9EUKA|nr:hypothetical protein PROFUN_06673 [Planoprotostelium fungivorum]
MGPTEPLPGHLKRMRDLHNPRASDRSDSSHFGITLTLLVPFRVNMKGSSYKTFMLAVNQWSLQIETGRNLHQSNRLSDCPEQVNKKTLLVVGALMVKALLDKVKMPLFSVQSSTN